MRRLGFLVLCVLIPAYSALAQQTAWVTDTYADFQEGVRHFDAGLFGQAYLAFNNMLERNEPANEPEYEMLRTKTELYRIKSAIRLKLPEAEAMALNFIQSHQPDPVATEATIEIANYYFNAGEYDNAIAYFGMLQSQDLTEEELSEVRFKQGYSHFVQKEFDQAESTFAQTREIHNQYYYPTNYYFAMCRFFAGDYDEAIAGFERVENSEKYRTYVPYYITQIYFAQEDYDRVIAYGEPKADGPIDNLRHIHHLVGQAYFENGDYARALPHLEYYEKYSDQMRAEDFFQLGFVQYDQGLCEKAIQNFRHISNEPTSFGQRANFYLADCYLRSGDSRAARNAFRAVSKMNYDPVLQEEALFNYGKLSAQLDYDFDAIHALDGIRPGSSYYTESQEILKDIFSDTRDYASALNTLNDLEALSPTLKEAYQRISLLRGLQLLTDGDITAAERTLKDVQLYPVDRSVSAQSLFWRGEIAYRKQLYDASIDLFNQYFTIARSVVEMPPASSIPVAHYNQGYNYLKKANYVTALEHFQNAVGGIRQHLSTYEQPYYANQILPDAILRAADCLFKRNRYGEALQYYQESIADAKYGYVYAKFQKAIIQGLMNRPLDKILQLEGLVQEHPNSRFADDALFHTALTYQEIGTADKALNALQALVQDHPNSEFLNAAYLRLGLISYNNGDLNASISYYKKVFANNPTSTDAQEALAALEEIYVQDLAEPTEYFAFVESIPGLKVSELRKDSVSFRTAEIKYEQAEYAAAVNAFAEYLQLFPNGTNVLPAYYYRAESNAALKNYDEAVSDYAIVIERGRSAYYLRALKNASLLTYHHQADFESAYRYHKLWAAETSDPAELQEARLGLMRSAYRTGRLEEAAETASKVAEYSNLTNDQAAEAAYYRGKAEYDRKNYDLALEQFNIVTRKSDNALTAEARYLIARIYYLRGQLELAEKLCHNANRESSNYPYWVAKCLLLLSDVYVQQDDLFNARAPLEALIENFEGDQEIINEAREKLQLIEQQQKEQSRVRPESTDSLELDTLNRRDDGN